MKEDFDDDQRELAPPVTETITIEINRSTLDRVDVRYPNRSTKITQDLNRYYYFMSLGRAFLQKKFSTEELNYLGSALWRIVPPFTRDFAPMLDYHVRFEDPKVPEAMDLESLTTKLHELTHIEGQALADALEVIQDYYGQKTLTEVFSLLMNAEGKTPETWINRSKPDEGR